MQYLPHPEPATVYSSMQIGLGYWLLVLAGLLLLFGGLLYLVAIYLDSNLSTQNPKNSKIKNRKIYQKNMPQTVKPSPGIDDMS